MTHISVRRCCSPRAVVLWAAAAAVIGAASHAWAQAPAAGVDWRQGTTLAGFVGGASPRSGTGAVAGAALGWELAPHLTIEGRGLWLDAGTNADAFAVLIGTRVPLLPARPAVPFASASIGMYRAAIGPEITAPAFYRRRIREMERPFARHTFDDFVVALGGGADVFLARHLALRPEVTVLLVTTRADTRTVPVYGISLAYHFESHPITPSR